MCRSSSSGYVSPRAGLRGSGGKHPLLTQPRDPNERMYLKVLCKVYSKNFKCKMLLLLLLLLLLLMTCQKVLYTRWLCLFNFIEKKLSLKLQKDDREDEKWERGKEREGDPRGPGKEAKIPRTTLRNIEVARKGPEPTLPFTRYKAINRLNP